MNTTYPCPQHHPSETADFCSVCGTEIIAGKPPASPVTVKGVVCPECGTPPDAPTQVFCEVCGYNFRTRQGGGAPVAAVEKPPSAPPPPTTNGKPAAALAASVRWEVVVEVDPNLYGTPNPGAPTDQPKQRFSLFERETLVGRAGTEVRVHVPIHRDAGVSRRQALLIRQPDGSLVLRDLGSANGTQVNGKDVIAGADTPVRDGDVIGVGAWSRLTLRASLVDAPPGSER